MAIVDVGEPLFKECSSLKGLAGTVTSCSSLLSFTISEGPKEVTARGEPPARTVLLGTRKVSVVFGVEGTEPGAFITSAFEMLSTCRTAPWELMITGASFRNSLEKLAPVMQESLEDTVEMPERCDPAYRGRRDS
jgi:hypothetical protein